MSKPDFSALTAKEALEGLKANHFTPSAYVGALSDRIERIDPEIQAWAHFDRAKAIAQAQVLDAENPSAKPLFGIPVGIKDVIDTCDMPTENGTGLDAGRQPENDAAVVKLLRDAGGVIMGKTVTAELAFLNPSKTRNPRNLSHTPGGSSSGSAAAVAAGMVPLALGTQTNGSTIRPASFCGVYALKPTEGRFPQRGVLEESDAFDTVGIFSRSLDDLALVSHVLTGGQMPVTLPRLEAAPKLAFLKTFAWPLATLQTQAAMTHFTECLGPDCEEDLLPPQFEDAVKFHRTIMYADMAQNYAPYYARGKDRLSDAIRAAIEEGFSTAEVDYEAAVTARGELHDDFMEFIRPYDAVVALSAPGPAPAGLDSTGNPVFATLWTYLGCPAVNVPLLTIEGMPAGVQVIARRFEEEKLLQIASWLVTQSRGGTE